MTFFPVPEQRALGKLLSRVLLGAGLVLSLSTCQTAEDQFIGRRLENLCTGAIPICNARAGCVLRPNDFLRGRFPGGFRTIVQTNTEKTRLVVRILLTNPLYSGSEIQVIAYDSGCGDFDEDHPRDMNLFDLAGNDNTLDFDVEVDGRGDHLLEVFSDMGAEFVMTVTLEE